MLYDFYGMLKKPVEYERDSASAKFTSFLAKFILLRYQVYLMVTARDLWWTVQE
jgi:hypothetical protein